MKKEMKHGFKKLGVIVNTAKQNASSAVKELLYAAKKYGMQIFLEKSSADFLGEKHAIPFSKMLKVIDLLISIGGDGTVLRVARELNGKNIPILGINIGGLGFLTSVSEKEIRKSLLNLSRGEYRLSHRSVLNIVHKNKNTGVIKNYRALNDAVIGRESASRMLTLEVSVNRTVVTSYRCDGIIISTPTGSTGHSLSAGGPILPPETDVFVLTLICPHTLSWRPLVISDCNEIIVKAVSNAPQRLTIDGQVGDVVAEGDEIFFTRSPKGVSFVHMPDYSYFDVLRRKLNWSVSNSRV